MPMPERKVRVLTAVALQTLLTSCARTPLVNIFGSYFPVWMFCIGGGVVMTLIARRLLMIARLDKELGPRVLIYPCMTGLFACAIWTFAFHD